MAMSARAQDIEMRFRLNQLLAFQNPPDSLIDGEAGKIGDGPLDNFLTLAN